MKQHSLGRGLAYEILEVEHDEAVACRACLKRSLRILGATEHIAEYEGDRATQPGTLEPTDHINAGVNNCCILFLRVCPESSRESSLFDNCPVTVMDELTAGPSAKLGPVTGGCLSGDKHGLGLVVSGGRILGEVGRVTAEAIANAPSPHLGI